MLAQSTIPCVSALLVCAPQRCRQDSSNREAPARNRRDDREGGGRRPTRARRVPTSRRRISHPRLECLHEPGSARSCAYSPSRAPADTQGFVSQFQDQESDGGIIRPRSDRRAPCISDRAFEGKHAAARTHPTTSTRSRACQRDTRFFAALGKFAR